MTPPHRDIWLIAVKDLTLVALGFLVAVISALVIEQESARDGSFDPQPTSAPAAFDPRRWGTANLYQATTPMDVTLRIVSRDEFARETAATNARLQPGYAVGGFTTLPTAKSRCVITLPDGMLIHAEPWRAYAEWISKDDGDVLAHELLHCVLGDWHPPLLCTPEKHS